jgi:hypothetical protein
MVPADHAHLFQRLSHDIESLATSWKAIRAIDGADACLSAIIIACCCKVVKSVVKLLGVAVIDDAIAGEVQSTLKDSTVLV